MTGAVLIDAGHVREQWKQQHAPRHEATRKPKNHIPPAGAILGLIEDIHRSIGYRFPLDHVHWLRTYYYDAEPFGGTITDPAGNEHVFARSDVYNHSTRLLDELRRADNVAVRLGRTKFGEWREATSRQGRYSPVFQQKGVDMKIGLDIAWMATKRIVDILILVTNDTDFVAPMKLARTEGVVVVVYCVASKLAPLLREHADIVVQGIVPAQ